KLRLSFSDGSAAPLFDSSVQNTLDTTNAVWTISFRAGATNQSLTVNSTVAQSFNTFGNITLQAATLATTNLPPTAVITNPPNHSVFLSPATLMLGAAASDPDGTVAKVEFFDGSTKLGQATGTAT